MKAIAKRLCRLEDQFGPVDRKPRKVSRTVVQRWSRGATSLENARCKRTLCADGTLTELVELAGNDEVAPDELDNWVASFSIERL